MNISLARRDTAALGRVVGGQGLLWPLVTPALTAVALLQALCRGAIDPDYWWHLAAGRWLIEHGRVPTTDPFSFTHSGQNWVAHEWLGELLIAAADRLGGYALDILLTAAILGGGLFLLWRATRLYGASRRTAALATAGALLFSLPAIAVRPQVWLFALIMALLHELVAHDVGTRRRLWHLPPLFALMININLLTLMAGLILALYALHRVVAWLRADGDRRAEEFGRARQVVVVGALCLAALCVNPRGPALIAFAVGYINPHALRLTVIEEWRPLPFAGLDIALYLGGAAATALALWAVARRRLLWPGLPALLFAVMAARSARYVPLFGVTAALACAWYVAAARREADTPPTAAPHLRRLIVAATLLAAALTLFSGREAQFRRTPDASAAGAYPVAATAWLAANAPGARLFADYRWGGYLDEALYPRSNVFIDGREEMYGDAVFGAYLDAATTKPGWQQILAEWRVDAVLLPPTSKLATALAADPGWRLAFHDADSVVYLPAAPLP